MDSANNTTGYNSMSSEEIDAFGGGGPTPQLHKKRGRYPRSGSASEEKRALMSANSGESIFGYLNYFSFWGRSN